MANKSIGIFKNIDLTSTNSLGGKVKQISGHIIPSGWTDNSAIDEEVINDTSHNYKLIDSVFIDWNGADLYSATPLQWNQTNYGSINTTGQLLSAIKAAYNHSSASIKINNEQTINSDVINLNNGKNITISYVDNNITINHNTVSKTEYTAAAGNYINKITVDETGHISNISYAPLPEVYANDLKISASNNFESIKEITDLTLTDSGYKINNESTINNYETIDDNGTQRTGIKLYVKTYPYYNGEKSTNEGKMVYCTSSINNTTNNNYINNSSIHRITDNILVGSGSSQTTVSNSNIFIIDKPALENTSNITQKIYCRLKYNNGIAKTINVTITANSQSSEPTDPELQISTPLKTTLADGEFTTITVTSNVPGKLTLTTASGTGWKATSSSASTANTEHNITVTNLTTITTAGSIAIGGIVATFTPTDTTNYNILTNQNVLTQAITLSAAESQTTYYWYAGTTKPTSLSEATTVTSYPAEQEYKNNSGAKSHIFVLTNSDKNVIFINPEMNSPITQVEVDTTTISGYKIFETAVGVANTKSVKITIS